MKTLEDMIENSANRINEVIATLQKWHDCTNHSVVEMRLQRSQHAHFFIILLAWLLLISSARASSSHSLPQGDKSQWNNKNSPCERSRSISRITFSRSPHSALVWKCKYYYFLSFPLNIGRLNFVVSTFAAKIHFAFRLRFTWLNTASPSSRNPRHLYSRDEHGQQRTD